MLFVWSSFDLFLDPKVNSFSRKYFFWPTIKPKMPVRTEWTPSCTKNTIPLMKTLYVQTNRRNSYPLCWNGCIKIYHLLVGKWLCLQNYLFFCFVGVYFASTFQRAYGHMTTFPASTSRGRPRMHIHALFQAWRTTDIP